MDNLIYDSNDGVFIASFVDYFYAMFFCTSMNENNEIYHYCIDVNDDIFEVYRFDIS